MVVMNSGCNTEQTAPLFGAANPRQSTTRIRHYKLRRKGRLGKLFPVHSMFRVVILHEIAEFGGNSIKWPLPFFNQKLVMLPRWSHNIYLSLYWEVQSP